MGIGGRGPRRVPGLRREEVATLAGISADYYLRLEQGRDRNPSVQVLQALARVLCLDADANDHLMGLAGDRPASRSRVPAGAGSARTASPREQVPSSVLELIEGWTHHPAYVQNRLTDVLAVNSLATALSPNYAPGVNLLRAVFLDPAERRLRRDWEEATAEGVASLRAGAGPALGDPGLVELVGELSLRSERFRNLWARHDVRPQKSRVSHLAHPQVGDIELQSDKLAVLGAEGLVLVVFHAVPDSRSAELLTILGSLAASGDGGGAHRGGQRSAEEQ